jgi:hypothetical protein
MGPAAGLPLLLVPFLHQFSLQYFTAGTTALKDERKRETKKRETKKENSPLEQRGGRHDPSLYR